MCNIFSLVLSITIFFSSLSWAADRYIDTSGSDTTDCQDNLFPCLTLQYAINQSNPGDTINIAAGTYAVAGLVTIDRTLTLLGAQAGVDARTRVASESILSNTQGISVSANNVVFDGLTISDSSVAAFTGYGIWLNPSIDGTRIVNTIFTNNIVGLGLSNGGLTQAVIEHNLFSSNNQAGGASGTGIYSDEFVSDAVSNVLINENKFINNNNAAIGFSSNDVTKPATNITITNNEIDNNGRGVYFFNTHQAVITDNTITNLTAPTDGGSSTGIALFGGNQFISIWHNSIETGVKYGIRIIELLPGDPSPPNSDILIHNNNIFGFSIAGMHIDNPPTNPEDYATCNWWGNITGPTNPDNPTGTGDVVEGIVTSANFDPWLLGPAPETQCGVPPTVSKSFTPTTVNKGEKSVLTILLSNVNQMSANIIFPFIDNLPDGLKVRNKPSTTCGGIVHAGQGRSQIILEGGAIPPEGSCTITAMVSGHKPNSYTNIIEAGDLVTNAGSNVDPTEAVLTIEQNQRMRRKGRIRSGGSFPLSGYQPCLAPENIVQAPQETPITHAPENASLEIKERNHSSIMGEGCSTSNIINPFIVTIFLVLSRKIKKALSL